jgi:hypothetical protein
VRDCADQGQARGRCRRRRGRDRAEIAKDAAAGETAPTRDKLTDAAGAVEGEIEAEIAKDAAAGETAPTKDKLADAGGAAEDEIEAEIAKIVEETVKPSKP